MAIIKEFSALRFTNKAGDIGALCCPPYDIISEAEKQALLKKNEYNLIKLELPEQTDAGYKGAGDTFKAWQQNGILATDDVPSLYIYEEKFSVKGVDYAFKGVVCYVKLAEFSEGIVLPHEETLSKAKSDRFNLINATGCSFSQIYSLYSDKNGDTARILGELSSGAPDQTFTDEAGVTHSLWIVPKCDKTAEICRQFENRKLYIADGHHRYETALNHRRYMRENGIKNENSEYVMMFLVDMENDGLVVFPTHRIVKGIDAFSGADLIKKAEKYFDITDLSTEKIESFLDGEYKNGKKAYVYYDGEKCCGLTLRDITVMDKLFPEKSEALRRLDVTVLHSLVLEETLGIDKENMANQKNLTYTRNLAEAMDSANGTADCCFILNPTRIEEIAAVAAAGEKMPQKSTYFYPKLTTGMVMNKIKEIK
ncbi:MAG: DUF1015 domain-containing protein [Clostridia bacterium]|nr:DUF1015 domain-containing protein [Clostridia bacterium]MBQ3562329.1 DUF1015 domain-containing protein [Clostridia bacterium]